MVEYLKKSLVICLVAVVCLSIFSGCGAANKTDEDQSSFIENESSATGESLNMNSVKLELDPQDTSVQMIQDFVKTNTKQITVSADNIPTDTEIELFLYIDEDLDNPIACATLTNKSKEVVFTNLTSAAAYKVGATISNSSVSVEIIISD